MEVELQCFLSWTEGRGMLAQMSGTIRRCLLQLCLQLYLQLYLQPGSRLIAAINLARGARILRPLLGDQGNEFLRRV